MLYEVKIPRGAYIQDTVVFKGMCLITTQLFKEWKGDSVQTWSYKSQASLWSRQIRSGMSE